MNCKVVINKDSGNCKRLDVEKLLSQLNCCTKVEIIDSKSDWSADGFDTVLVCGGDGTLHNAIEKCRNCNILYAPCGTLNEAALTEKIIEKVGKVNDSLFSYVCAAGSFTDIGYKAKNDSKKRWKSLAYLPQVLKSYRCFDIAAKLNVDGKKYDGNYTLLMVLKSHRCFGFPFNKDYKKTKKNYLVAVKSFGKDSFANRIKMFFPFFRIFVCGAKPQIKRNWMLLPFENLTMELEKPQDFCFDGEKRALQGNLCFSEQTLGSPITVLKTPFLKGRKNERNSPLKRQFTT